MKNSFTILMVAISIVGCNTFAQNNNTMNDKEKKSGQVKTAVSDTTPRVTGVGGIFFFTENPKETREWYGKNLGFSITNYGSIFESRNVSNPDEINSLIWSPFKMNTDYFAPSKKEFMINYRVQNLEGLVRNLKKNGVTIIDKIEASEYGKFVHIMDPFGNKIELWEPIDSVQTKTGGEATK
jgi:predicted enzyme related to lactoylglutathione lyase